MSIFYLEIFEFGKAIFWLFQNQVNLKFWFKSEMVLFLGPANMQSPNPLLWARRVQQCRHVKSPRGATNNRPTPCCGVPYVALAFKPSYGMPFLGLVLFIPEPIERSSSTLPPNRTCRRPQSRLSPSTTTPTNAAQAQAWPWAVIPFLHRWSSSMASLFCSSPPH
jgi:hypothetical protein